MFAAAITAALGSATAIIAALLTRSERGAKDRVEQLTSRVDHLEERFDLSIRSLNARADGLDRNVAELLGMIRALLS